jgi:D-alanyl-D-alanine carboxypeptidase
MKLFRWILLLALASAVTSLPAKPKGRAAGGTGSFTGAIVLDADSGQVLFEENADVTNPPASMTKLMTYAVLHDKLADGSLTLQTPVQVDASDSRMGGTQVYLDPRETFPVEELIYAMMIQSANDAAHALARTAAGSVDAFVGLMNAKARALGMTHTVFRSPHGLPPPSRRVADGDLTTPRDFALLCRYLVLETDVLKYTSVKERMFGPARANGPMRMDNHNKLLGHVVGVDGLKTGYTESAGYCLSATALRNGRRVITVIMGAFGPNHSVDKGHSRDLKAIELMERGFASLPAKIPGTSSTAAAAAPGVSSQPAAPAAAPLPTVKTAPADAGSTAGEPVVTFKVIPPNKSP